MNTLRDVWTWLTDGANWRGVEGVPHRLAEHVTISAESMAIAVVLAVPVALVLGHLRRFGALAIGLSNIGRAVPSLALLVVCAQVFGLSSGIPVVVALTALAVPPMVTNTYVGVTEVDAKVVESAKGMGLSGRQVLVRVELPMAMPLIMAAIRTSAVQVVATATLAAWLAQGGLGRFILDGQSQNDVGKLVGGAVLVALLAIATEAALALAQRALSPMDRVARGRAAASRHGAGADEPGTPGALGVTEPADAKITA